MSAFQTLQGCESKDHTTPEFSNAKIQTHRKPNIKVGMQLRVLLPDLVTSEMLETDLEEVSDLGADDLPRATWKLKWPRSFPTTLTWWLTIRQG